MKDNVIFWNVDTQNDFVMSNGKLSVPEAESIRPELAKLTELAKENNITVVSTLDWHNSETEEISDNPDFINTFPEHCMENTNGANFVFETIPEMPCVINHSDKSVYIEEVIQHRNIVIKKDKFDVFEGNPHTEKILESIPREDVIVYGVATQICVNFAVLGLLERGKNVYVVSDAIKGLPGIESPIESWKNEGVIMITYDELENMITNKVRV